MELKSNIKDQFRIRPQFAVQFTSILVTLFGLYIIANSLLDQIYAHRGTRFTDFLVDFPILLGISVIYLSTLLRRRKRTAWVVTVSAFLFYLGFGVSQFLTHIDHYRMGSLEIIRDIIFPLIVLGFLFKLKEQFVVKSDIQGFRFALKFVVVLFIITLIYGVAGFRLMDDRDFHQEINTSSALHYTIDQFNLTTSKPVKPYTKRAHLFVDSLSFISLIAVLYAMLSLFQPLKARFNDQSLAIENVKLLLEHYGGESEEFFKYWPKDKQYYFDDSGQSVIAFHVMHGVALALSDPIGDENKYSELISGFLNLCFYNDWLPSFIHVSDKHLKLYELHGFKVQKLGQEAIVDINNFVNNIKNEKYFRQISNRFSKQSYSFELLEPPHHQAILDRLKTVSDDWLSKGGRAERGFAMGYYTNEYMQMCRIGVARDAANTIQAFINILPTSFNTTESTYDLLRQSSKALSNINDFLLINLMEELRKDNYKILNMGLSPLAGFNEEDSSKEQSLIDNVLKFAYNNGDRFYSFSGLHRFKSKYEPSWQDKYVVYKGGIRGFSRTLTALTRLMSKSVKN